MIVKDLRYTNDICKELNALEKDLKLLRNFEKSIEVKYTSVDWKINNINVAFQAPEKITNLRICDIIDSIENIVDTLAAYRTCMISDHYGEKNYEKVISRIEQMCYLARSLIDEYVNKLQVKGLIDYRQFINVQVDKVLKKYNIKKIASFSQASYINEDLVVSEFIMLQSMNRSFFLIISQYHDELFCDIAYSWQRIEYLLPQLKVDSLTDAVEKQLISEGIKQVENYDNATGDENN